MSDVPAVRVLTSPSSAPLMESPRLCSFLSTFQLGLPRVPVGQCGGRELSAMNVWTFF